MQRRINQKWRPPLALILGGVLGFVLLLPMAGLVMLRDLSPMMGWREAAALLGFGIAAIAGLLGYLLWRLILGPVNALVTRAEGLAQGHVDAQAPLSHYGTPEMQRLGQSVMDMAAALDHRHSNLQQYSAHVTHEMKSPLTTIQGAAEMLDQSEDPAEVAQLAQLIRQSSDRMQRLLDGLRALAASRIPLDGPDARLSELELAHLDVVLTGDDPLPMSKAALQMVCDHLAQNAVDHGATTLTLRYEAGVLHVADNGSGITLGNSKKIFEPFFTTKRESGGTGMGLAIVAAVLETHGGQITWIPSDTGAAFEISF
ncbi:sensor histidine kinase [Algirhabdus cladophorae]|uniref:sensor histidine kinase n=1 Tax=Algirhabdus cladophorae TaxID=3377108 RepID=UPI003B849EDA